MTVGVISKALGLKGEAFVHPDPDVAHDFAPGDEIASASAVEHDVAIV